MKLLAVYNVKAAVTEKEEMVSIGVIVEAEVIR